MKNVLNSHPDSDIQALRAGIRQTYDRYRALDRDRFPDIEYNTNRANYESLRVSFEQELFDVQRVDRNSPAIHIPSTNTLALLFTDDQYVPGPKILMACQWYAENSIDARPVGRDDIRTTRTWVQLRRWPGLLLLVLAVGGLLFYLFNRSGSKGVPSGLTIRHPRAGQVVPRLLYVEGSVTNADTVWLIVHPIIKPMECYVQLPIKVETDGTWKGHIYIGTNDDQSVGYSFDIRAFVEPEKRYKFTASSTNYTFDSWPAKAALSTKAVTVVRGKNRY